MECGLCQRPHSARRRPVCISCVQATLYKPRVNQVRARQSRDTAHTHVEAVVRPGNDGVLAALPQDADWDAITAGISTRSYERAKVERNAVDLRIEDISLKAKELQAQIDDHKRYIAERKNAHEQRRQAISAEREELLKSREPTLEPVRAAIKKTSRHLEKMHTRTAEAREYLCREVGALCGLRRGKDKTGRTVTYLNGLQVPNLKDLNCLNGRIRGERLDKTSTQPVTDPHEIISASLDNVCLFLGICCHYLSVRLPAEIILMNSDFPHAALMQREASYKAGEPRYPGVGSKHSSPDQSRTLSAAVERGRPRLLQLQRPVVQLQKQDHKTYGSFIEGVMLLAYNVAWLCRTQGTMEGTPSFDDVCDIGRNLCNLTFREDRNTLEGRAANKPGGNVNAAITFGRFSHSSAAHSLSGHKGSALFAPDAWRVSVTTMTDKLKSFLRNETARSEWHIIDNTEWDDVLEHEQAVMIGGGSIMKRPLDVKGPAMSVMSVAPHDGADDSSNAKNAKGKGNSGWTKLRGRGGGV